MFTFAIFVVALPLVNKAERSLKLPMNENFVFCIYNLQMSDEFLDPMLQYLMQLN